MKKKSLNILATGIIASSTLLAGDAKENDVYAGHSEKIVSYNPTMLNYLFGKPQRKILNDDDDEIEDESVTEQIHQRQLFSDNGSS